MKRSTAAALLIVLTLCALPGVLSVSMSPSFAFSQGETVTQTFPITFHKPSVILKALQNPEQPGFAGSIDPPQPKSFIPSGITNIVPNNADKTITATGTQTSVNELKQLLGFLDVKPRQVVLRTRLQEISLAPDGGHTRTILQTSLLNATNNQTVHTAISGANQDEITVLLTPHINGDHSISLQAKFQRHWENEENENKPQMSETSTHVRLEKTSQWNLLRTMSFSEDKDIQRNMMFGKTVPPAAAYPLYRLEVFFTEAADNIEK